METALEERRGPGHHTGRRGGPHRAHLNHRHELILNWLVSNKGSLRQCAEEFGYRPSHLSKIIHTDLFQARYRERCRELGEVALHSTAAKLNHLAHLSLEQSIKKLEMGEYSERFLTEARDSVLERLGYSSKPQRKEEGEQKHLHLHVDAETLTRAREKAAGTITVEEAE